MANYDHPADGPRGLHYAMEYNNLGQPVVRVTGSTSQYSNTGNTNTNIDAFGRQRTSDPFTVFDNNFRYSDNTLEWDTSTSGSGSKSHLPSESTIAMSVTASSGDSVIRETKKVFQYQPGKSLLIMNTFVMAPAQSGLRQRVGYFGAENGIYIEQNGTTTNIVKRSSITSSVENTQVAQGDWNVDNLNGTGPSGLYLDMEKAQIFWMDLEWLGVGSVRTGFVINGQFIVCHIFHHANQIDSVYMTSASLPIRYEITNTSATSSNATLKQICSTVISEGGHTPRIIPRAASTAVTGLSLSDTVYKPLVSLRLRSDKLDGIVVPAFCDMFGIQQAAFKYRIIQNPTISTGSWVSAGAESTVEYNVTATDTVNTGTVLMEGIFVGNTKGGSQNINLKDFNHAFQLRRQLDGTREIFTLAAIATTNNDDAVGSITWQEFN